MKIFVKFVVLLIYHLSICNKNKCTSPIFTGGEFLLKIPQMIYEMGFQGNIVHPKSNITEDDEDRSDEYQYLIKTHINEENKVWIVLIA